MFLLLHYSEMIQNGENKHQKVLLDIGIIHIICIVLLDQTDRFMVVGFVKSSFICVTMFFQVFFFSVENIIKVTLVITIK